ncbi:MAG TPA: hypothetical protein VGL92_00340, partial [Acidimicrobiia bacterium]
MAPRSTAPAAPGLEERAQRAIDDPDLQAALGNITATLGRGLRQIRTEPALMEARRRAAGIRREVLSDLDGWLDRAQTRLESLGVTVHRA